MNTNGSNRRQGIARAQKGEFREYWLQLYIKNNYERLGFDSLEGPFETGPDFKGVYKGKKVVIEAETQSRNFIYHRHNPNEVDILIVLNDDNAGEVLGMKPVEWRKRLPKKIILVDPEDFLRSTHEMRKDYAIAKSREREAILKLLPFFRIKHAFAILWSLLIEETPYEGTPEADVFEQAIDSAAIQYIKVYDLDLEKLREGLVFTRIEILANDLIKSRRDFDALTSEEKDFLEDWLGILRVEYGSRV